MTETQVKKPKKEEKQKVERVRQNGVTRPAGGGKCQFVWDIADKLSEKLKRPALRDEVLDAVVKARPDSSVAMIGTNYSLWVRFHNAGAAIKQYRDSLDTDKQAKLKAKEEEKAKKAAEAAAKKEAAAKAKAEKAKAAKAAKPEKPASSKKSA